MIKRYRILSVILGIFTVLTFSTLNAAPKPAPFAQTNTCTQLVELALTEVGEHCGGMDRNSSCYGYDQVTASFSQTVPDDFFSRPADRAALAQLASIHTAPFNLEQSHWGVALMNVQANVPNTLPGQAVTFILMGDTQVHNAVANDEAFISSETVEVTVAAEVNANIRTLPNANSNSLGVAGSGSVLVADAISLDGEWARISFAQRHGWVMRHLLTDGGIVADLPALDESVLSPMQAFHFTTGIGSVECSEAPDVLFVQGPQELKVNLNVNGADVMIGSTIALENRQSSYSELASDPQLAQQYSTTLTGKGLADDVVCNQTTMVMLEGEAILNEYVSMLPIGHAIDSISCIDDAGNVLFATPWRGLRRLPQEALDKYRVIEQVPETVLRYKVHIPTDAEIDVAVREMLKLRPSATPTYTPTMTPMPTTEAAHHDVPPEKTVIPTVTPYPTVHPQ